MFRLIDRLNWYSSHQNVVIIVVIFVEHMQRIRTNAKILSKLCCSYSHSTFFITINWLMRAHHNCTSGFWRARRYSIVLDAKYVIYKKKKILYKSKQMKMTTKCTVWNDTLNIVFPHGRWRIHYVIPREKMWGH